MIERRLYQKKPKTNEQSGGQHPQQRGSKGGGLRARRGHLIDLVHVGGQHECAVDFACMPVFHGESGRILAVVRGTGPGSP